MTWASRFRLLVGTILVLVLAALATYQLNQKKGVAASDSAQILARTYDVGTPYAGLVVDQMVDVGDSVTKGQPLFVIDSSSLQYDLKNGFAKPQTEATQVDDQGRLVLLAAGDGTVTAISSERGTFVQSATELATVQRANTLYVQAEYTLTPNEYARVEDNATATVELPNHRTITAHVAKVKVETVAGDGRLSLEREAPQGFDVLAVDAFSGDSIPVHLITVQAVDEYLRHIKPGGVIAFHVTNRFLDLKPVLLAIAQHKKLAYAYVSELRDGGISDWVLLTRNEAFLREPGILEATKPVAPRPDWRLWTDDYNNLVKVFRY